MHGSRDTNAKCICASLPSSFLLSRFLGYPEASKVFLERLSRFTVSGRLRNPGTAVQKVGKCHAAQATVLSTGQELLEQKEMLVPSYISLSSYYPAYLYYPVYLHYPTYLHYEAYLPYLFTYITYLYYPAYLNYQPYLYYPAYLLYPA